MTIDGEEYWTDQTEPVGVHTFEIESAEATKVNEITVTFADAVDSENVTLVVTRGDAAVPTDGVEWNDDEDVAVITTSSKMTKGTYTVTATDTETEDSDSIDFEVVAQYVDEIVIDDDVALLDPNNQAIAYAYYDVLDQYGESMRTSASITWAGSCTITPNKSTGRLTLAKNPAAAWVYGEKIYVTGVNAKTGTTISKELSVGTKQALDSIKMKGFVKKGTSTLITPEEGLPAGFKDGEYYMVFDALDQNGNPLTVGTITTADVTFTSSNPLVIASLQGIQAAPVTAGGVDYNGVGITPGIQVSKGGEVTISAIANNTGNKTDMNFIVGEDPVVDSFKLTAPSSVVADGDTNIEIPFTALDKEGNEITNFRTLAKQKTFNTISFTSANSTLSLEEQDDGTAKLFWSDTMGLGWNDAETTNGIDRPVSLTVVVVGGEGDTLLLNVADKRRPDSIAAIDLDKVMVEGDTLDMKLSTLDYYDQYGEAMDDADALAFFAAGNTYTGADFQGYQYSVKATYSGNQYLTGTNDGNTYGVALTSGTSAWVLDNTHDTTTALAYVTTNTAKSSLKTTSNVDAAKTGESLKFEIVRALDADKADATKYESVSPAKTHPITVVDITQVKNLAIDDLDTFYIGSMDETPNTATAGQPDNSGTQITGEGQLASEAAAIVAADNTATEIVVADTALTSGLTDATAGYQQTVVVKGTYNGEEVTVPTSYYRVEGTKIGPTTSALKDVTIDTLELDKDTPANYALKISDLYDITTAKNTSKLASDTLTATLFKTNGLASTTAAINYYKINTTTYVAGATSVADGYYITADTINAGADYSDAIATLETALTTLDTTVANVTITETAASAAAAHQATTARASILEALGLYDTATIKVSISDQKPKASAIVGLDEEYTFNPTTTKISTANILADLEIGYDDVYVVDQYGVYHADWTAALTFTVKNVEENEDGYAENNFKVNGNATTTPSIVGAELGDEFDLVISYGSLSETVHVTVGADANARVDTTGNVFRTTLIGDGVTEGLEKQRLAGLG